MAGYVHQLHFFARAALGSKVNLPSFVVYSFWQFASQQLLNEGSAHCACGDIAVFAATKVVEVMRALPPPYALVCCGMSVLLCMAGVAGVELNFMRAQDYFPVRTPQHTRTQIMHAFVRDVRVAMDGAARGLALGLQLSPDWSNIRAQGDTRPSPPPLAALSAPACYAAKRCSLNPPCRMYMAWTVGVCSLHLFFTPALLVYILTPLEPFSPTRLVNTLSLLFLMPFCSFSVPLALMLLQG